MKQGGRIMRLNKEGLQDRQWWLDRGYQLPEYDREAVAKATKAHPVWIHFGVGNIFRAFMAEAAQKLLNQGLMGQGIIGAEGFDDEIIENVSRPCDDYSIAVTLCGDGSVKKSVTGSITRSLCLNRAKTGEFWQLEAVFSNPSLQMASFTITEKGYSLSRENALLPEVASDLKAGPKRSESYLGKVAALLYTRFKAGAYPLAMVSMDNCSHNGERLAHAMEVFAKGWEENGLADRGFYSYVCISGKVTFPWTMIDKITPRPSDDVQKILEADGLEGMTPVVTKKHTYVAPYVNAEESQYLVIEDAFPAGRPPLEKAGIIFTDRATVELTEQMKVCTCLNPLHTALAIFGCLLGYEKICDEMKDEQLNALVRGIGYKEGLPAAADPGILKPVDFLDTVVDVRLPNPFMPDTPQRIATDTSQKLSIRFGGTIRAYMEDPGLDVHSLRLIPLVLAGWLRYLTGIDDKGNAMALSPDPVAKDIAPYVCGLEGQPAEMVMEKLSPVLKNTEIFGVDLFKAELAALVCQDFCAMNQGPGAVRKTLKDVLALAKEG